MTASEPTTCEAVTPAETPRCARCGFVFMEGQLWGQIIDGSYVHWPTVCPVVIPHDLTEKQKEDRRQFYKEIGV